MESRIELRLRDGLTSTPPLLNDSVLPNLTPSNFYEWFCWQFETSGFFLETFEAIVCARARQKDASPETGFQNHSDWNFLRPALDNKPMLPQAIIPHSTPNNDLAFFEVNNKRFLLPLVKHELFNLSGLDAERFIEEVLEINPGRFKELDHVSILIGATQFALQRFQGAMPGLDQQFIKQFGVEPGVTALWKHIRDREAVKVEEQDFSTGLQQRHKVWTGELYRRDADKYIIRSRASRDEVATTHGTPIHNFNLLRPIHDESASIRRVHYMSGDYWKKLASSGRALIVSRVSIEEQADSVTKTHFHRLEPASALGSKSTKVKVLGAHNRSIVIPFETDAAKDTALAHIQQARFNFVDEQNVRLDVTQLSEGTAKKTNFVLGSAPLKSLGRLDDALRPFFAIVGHVLIRDVASYPFRGSRITSKVIISHEACLEWLQKFTVTRDGPQDQQIRVEWPATCIYCNQVDKADPIRLGGPSQPPRRHDNAQNERNAPNNQVQKRSITNFQTPKHKEVVPGNGNAPQQNRYQDRPVAALRAPFPTDNGPKDGNVPQQAANTRDRARSANAFQTPAGASNSRTNINAPNRKRYISPDASNIFKPRPRLQGQ